MQFVNMYILWQGAMLEIRQLFSTCPQTGAPKIAFDALINAVRQGKLDEAYEKQTGQGNGPQSGAQVCDSVAGCCTSVLVILFC
jgi:hypothetical protein